MRVRDNRLEGSDWGLTLVGWRGVEDLGILEGGGFAVPFCGVTGAEGFRCLGEFVFSTAELFGAPFWEMHVVGGPECLKRSVFWHASGSSPTLPCVTPRGRAWELIRRPFPCPAEEQFLGKEYE